MILKDFNKSGNVQSGHSIKVGEKSGENFGPINSPKGHFQLLVIKMT